MIEAWSSLYSDHAALRTAVEFVHIAGLVAGGGCAITADLATIAVGGDAASRTAAVRLLEGTHRIVLLGLTALFLSGGLLLAADVETYWPSRLFWIKMALVAVLLVNGALIVRTEGQAEAGQPHAVARLHTLAITSLLLWGLTTLVGTALPNLG